MKISDVRMRGRMFTLHKAAEEMGVTVLLANELLTVIYSKANMFGERGEYLFDFATDEQRGQEMSTNFSVEDLQYCEIGGESTVPDMLREELLSVNGAGYQLTEKMMEVLKRAAEIQRKLDDEHFHCCPCCG